MNWLAQLVPTVASALGGPLAGMAASFVAKHLGLDADDVDSVNKALQGNKLSADQVAALQQAELELKARADEMKLDFAKLAAADTAGARQMQVQTRSWVPAILAMLITAGFFGILSALMLGKAEKSDALMLMLGSLGTAWTGVCGFYFGSSQGARDKDQLLYNSTPLK